MSNEKKIKELMARLVSMSPEPPPYPEESPVARPAAARKRRPALVFVGAAALVVLLAVPLLLMNGGEDPVVAGSSTTTSTTSPETSTTTPATTSTSEPGTTTTTATAAVDVSGIVYLFTAPENSFGGNPALVPISVTVQVSGASEEEVDFFTAWQWVVEGREGLPGDLETSVPTSVRVESTSVEGDMIVADMNEAFLAGAAEPGLLSDMTMLNQLIYTLTSTDPETSVLFTVNGEPVEAYGSEGLDLTEPVERETFRDDHLHLINLTGPVLQQDNGSYLVEGIANVFEASLTWQILDGAGEVVHEEFTTASCGTGCWGEFAIEVSADLIVPGESSIRLFTYSAEDGSATNMITIPIPEDGIWQFNAGE